MTDAAAPPPKLGMGNVIRGTFGVLKRNFTTYLVLILAMYAVPAAVIVLGVVQMAAGGAGAGVGLIVIGAIIASVTASVLQGGLIHAAVADLNGRQTTVAECVSTGLRHCLPLLGIILVMILAYFASFFAVLLPVALIGGVGAFTPGGGGGGTLVLLMIPALLAYVVAVIMVGVAWCLVIPSQVVERTGVFAAFSRSGRLTKHNRWRIFGLVLLWTIVSSVIQGTLTNLVGAGWSGPQPVAGQAPLAALAAVGPAYWAVITLVSILGAMVGGAGIANIYYELRRVKEGVGPEALASVFD